jgi:membrane protease YdiL (CAAX protease family)
MTTQTITTDGFRKASFNWRLFWVMLGMIAFGLLALIPYGLTLSGQTFSAEMLPLMMIQFIGQIVLYGVLILVGLKLASKIGLGAPWLESRLSGKKASTRVKRVGNTILLGLIAGIAILLLDLYIFAPVLAEQFETLGETLRPPAWQGFLAAFYGGIVEEVMTRLFLLTLLAWLGSKISHTTDGKPTPLVMWVAILIAGLIFGVGHLPAAVTMGIELTHLYVVRSLVLNGVGILYGWLYWQRGLESAMLAHFSTDIAVHVIGALLLG